MTDPVHATLMPRRGFLGRRARVATAAIALAFVAVGVGVAAAFWLATDSSNPARAAADSLQAGPPPTLSSINGQDVAISWSATSTVGGYPAGGYTIARYSAPSGGTATAATGGCSGTVAALSCTEQQVPAGTWYYAATPRIFNWAGAEGTRSTAVTVVAASLSFTANQIFGSLPATLTGGSITHFKASETVTFHLDTPTGTLLSGTVSSVNGSGQASGFSVTIPAGTSDGTHVVVAVGGGGSQATGNSFTIDTVTPTVTIDAVSKSLLGPSDTSVSVTWHANENGTYSVRVGGTDCATGTQVASGSYSSQPSQVMTTVNATSLAQGPNTIRVCVTDVAVHTGSAATTVTLDTVAPSGGSVTYTDGYYTSLSVAVTLVKGTDTTSGVAATGNLLQRASTTLATGTCGTFSSFSTRATDPAVSPSVYNDATVVAGNCYQYRYLVSDNAGNTATYTTSAVAKIDTSAPTFGAPALTLTAGSNSFVSGTTAFYNSNVASAFTVAAPNVGDPESAIQKVNFPTIGGGISGGGDDTTSPYSAAYSSSGIATGSGSQTVTATDNANLTATTAFTVTPDGAAPTGGSLAANGTGATGGGGSSSYSTTGTFSGTRTDFTDSGSGLASSTLTRSTASLSANTCGVFGSTTTVVGAPSENTVANGCYQYVLTGTDNVGNATSLTTVVNVDKTAPTGSITAPAAAATVSGSSVTVSSNSADGESGVASAQFQVSPSPGSFASLGSPDTTSPYGVTWDTTGGSFPNGNYDLRVITTDNAGNSFTSAVVTVTVTNGNPLTYAATGTVTTWTNSTTKAVTYPSGTATNDLVLLVETNNTNQNINTPVGWTLLADQLTTSPNGRFTVWWKNAGAESSVSLNVGTDSTGAAAWVVRYTRPTPAAAVLAAAPAKGFAAASTTLTPGAVTTSQPSATVISLAAVRAANPLSLSTPQGFSFRNATTATPPGGVSDALGIADQVVPTSGTTPASPTWSQTGTAAQWAWVTAAFS